jgi:hypothetical protein
LAGGEPILRDAELADLTTQLLRIHRTSLPQDAGSANAMDVEFALTRERSLVILQARPYTIVYSLDRAQRSRPQVGLLGRMSARLRQFVHRIDKGFFNSWVRRPV